MSTTTPGWECPDCGEKYCNCFDYCTCDIGPVDECPIHYPVDEEWHEEDGE